MNSFELTDNDWATQSPFYKVLGTTRVILYPKVPNISQVLTDIFKNIFGGLNSGGAYIGGDLNSKGTLC